MSKDEEIKKILAALAPVDYDEKIDPSKEAQSIKNEIDGNHNSVNNTQVSAATVGTIVNSNIIHNHPDTAKTAKTEAGDRKTLNRLVTQLQDEFHQSRVEVWKGLHEIFNLKSGVADLKLSQIKPAEKILSQQIELAELRQSLEEAQTQRTARESKIAADSGKAEKTLMAYKLENQRIATELEQTKKSLQAQEFTYKKEVADMKGMLTSLKAESVDVTNHKAGFITLIAIILVSFVAILYLVMSKQTLASQLTMIELQAGQCRYGDDYFTVGEVFPRKDYVSIECAKVIQGAPPQWIESKNKQEKKPTARKKPIQILNESTPSE